VLRTLYSDAEQKPVVNEAALCDVRSFNSQESGRLSSFHMVVKVYLVFVVMSEGGIFF